MSKELRVDFQGVIALVPDRKFADGPRRVEAILRNLSEPRKIKGDDGTESIVGVHNAWLEFPPDARVIGDRDELEGVSTVVNGFTRETRSVFLLEREAIDVQPDDRELPDAPVTIDETVLSHLAVYQGRLKPGFECIRKGNDALAACLSIAGGALSVVEKTIHPYHVPLHDGSTAAIGVATTVRWTIPFTRDVVLRFAQRPSSPILRLAPAGDVLQLAIRNRELDQLLKPRMPAIGGQDDPEFVVYGDSIEGGQAKVLEHAGPLIPSGRRACGLGGIQP